MNDELNFKEIQEVLRKLRHLKKLNSSCKKKNCTDLIQCKDCKIRNIEIIRIQRIIHDSRKLRPSVNKKCFICRKNPAKNDGYCCLECKQNGVKIGREAGRRFASSSQRKAVLNKYDFKCYYCNKVLTNKTANIDHKVPWPAGLTVISNLVPACKDCNREKGTRSKKSFLKYRKKLNNPEFNGFSPRWKGWRVFAPEENGPVIVRKKDDV